MGVHLLRALMHPLTGRVPHLGNGLGGTPVPPPVSAGQGVGAPDVGRDCFWEQCGAVPRMVSFAMGGLPPPPPGW